MTSIQFAYKEIITSHHHQVPPKPIIPVPKKSLNYNKKDPLDDNLIIHGDNLEALKALLPLYGGRIDCIYIDPPYNIGNEGWAYNDNVNSPLMKHWFKKTVDAEDLERHDKWCCMMWPRLKLLKELLADDGVIFVSIDHNEQHSLRMMMDEIFGEDTFRNIISVRRGVKNLQSQFETADSLNAGWESIMFYSRSPETRFKHLTKHLDEVRAGSWNNHWRGTDRKNLRYSLMGINIKSGQWRWEKKVSLKAIENYKKMIEEVGESPTAEKIDEWYFSQSPEKPKMLRKSGSGKLEHYVPPTDRKILSTLWTDLIANETSRQNNPFKDSDKFDNPKNVKLIERIIQYVCGTNKSSLVLDSFAGSGTTAHAVLEVNRNDRGNRKFILVECEDYADTITAERVRHAIKEGKSRTAPLKGNIGESFTYCKMGKPIDVNQMLTGKDLPDYSTLASHLLYMSSMISTEKTLGGGVMACSIRQTPRTITYCTRRM